MTSDETTPRVDGREERGDRTARALVLAARQAFAERGFAGASVRDIARAANANPALIRYHFGSKEGLYQRVIQEAMEDLRERLVGALQREGTLLERLNRVIEAQVDHLTEARDFPRLVQRALLDNDEGALTIARKYLRPMLDTVRPLIAAAGETPLGSLNDIIMSFFGAVMGPFIYAPMLSEVFGEDTLSPEAIARRKEHLHNLLATIVEMIMGRGTAHSDPEP
jgi:AcrR family transcriptional regulator